MKKLQINIYDNELVWKGMLDSVNYLKHSKAWHEIQNSTMKVSRNAVNVEEVQVGRILVVNNDKAFPLIVEEMVTSLDDQYWEVTLIPLKAMLNYRICHPTDYAGTKGAKQSEYMLSLASYNLVSQTRDSDRKFWNAARTKNMFSTGTYVAYGDTMDFTVDWNTGNMGDAITAIAKMNSTVGSFPIGWNIFINNTWDAFVMECYKATDRSVQQAVNPPVIFSEAFGNIKNATFLTSIKDWKNVGYFTWQDANNADQVTAVGNTGYGATVSFNRKEIVLSSSKKTSTEVSSEGHSELNSRPKNETFTAEIINNENTISTFNLDWFLGDVVTIQSAELKASVNAQVIQVDETYENGEYTLEATFGEPKLNFLQIIKNAIRK